MTKKDYQIIALAIKGYLDDGDNDMLDGNAGGHKMAEMIADALAEDNSKFNKDKFGEACGITIYN